MKLNGCTYQKRSFSFTSSTYNAASYQPTSATELNVSVIRGIAVVSMVASCFESCQQTHQDCTIDVATYQTNEKYTKAQRNRYYPKLQSARVYNLWIACLLIVVPCGIVCFRLFEFRDVLLINCLINCTLRCWIRNNATDIMIVCGIHLQQISCLLFVKQKRMEEREV